MGPHIVICHLAEVTFPFLPQPIKAVFNVATLDGCKAKLTWLHTEVVYPLRDGHPSQC